MSLIASGSDDGILEMWRELFKYYAPFNNVLIILLGVVAISVVDLWHLNLNRRAEPPIRNTSKSLFQRSLGSKQNNIIFMS